MSHERCSIPRAVAPFVALALAACASAPETRTEQRILESEANATLQAMTARDPSLRELVDRAYGYVVFPEIVEGGLVVGGAQGTGVVYERGRPIGYASLNQGTLGFQIGGQTFSQLVLLEDRAALERLKADNFDLTAEIEATVLAAGAGARTRFENGVAVIVSSEAGLMAGATIGGLQIDFEPMV